MTGHDLDAIVLHVVCFSSANVSLSMARHPGGDIARWLLLGDEAAISGGFDTVEGEPP